MPARPEDTHCPIPQMTFGEMARYLQQGYDAPIQRAIEAHVTHCNACRIELERAQALRQAGRHLMIDHLLDEEAAAPVLDETALAAYAAGTLSRTERERVTHVLATNHAAYRQWAALQRELGTPLTAQFRTPEDVKAAVKAPVPAPARSYGATWTRLRQRLDAEIERLLAPRWPATALAFALGVLLMLLLFPLRQETTLIPLSAPAEAGTGGRALFGFEDTDATDALHLPAGSDRFVLTWPTNENARSYHVQVFDAEGALVLDTEPFAENRWAFVPRTFEPGKHYTVWVFGNYEDGGGKIAELAFRR